VPHLAADKCFSFPLLGSYLADRFGRKPVIWVASLCGVSIPFPSGLTCRFVSLRSASQVAGPLLSGLGGNVGTFIGGRVITGYDWSLLLPTHLINRVFSVACSFFQVTAAPLIAEIAHPRFRAVVSATYLCTWYIGAVVCGLIGIGMVQWGHSASWRVMTVLQCLGVLPLVIWSALPWMAESPRFLIKKGKNAQALRILADLHANGDQQDDLVVNEYREICTSVEIDVASSGARYLDFFKTPGNRKRLGLIAFISWAQTMSGNNLIGKRFTAVVL